MKGIGIVERHFEKVLLGLVALAIGGFVAYDLLTPTRAKIGGKQVLVAEVQAEMQKAADAVTAAQGGSEVPFQIPEVPEGVEAAIAPLNKPAASADRLPRVMPPLASGIFSGAVRPIPLYHEPSFGAPKMIAPVAQSDGAVSLTPGKDDGFKAFLDQRPAGWAKGDSNVIWTTPAAELDMAAVRAEFERAENEAKPPREKLPLHWWQQRDRSIWILDVFFEREELLADGSWSKAVTVEPMPGLASFRGKTISSPTDIADLMRKNAGMQASILRPAYRPVVAGSDPVEARGAQRAAAETKDLQAARRRLADAQKSLEKEEAALQAIGGEYYDPPPADGKGKGKGKGKGGSGGDSGQGEGSQGSGSSGGKSGGGGMGPTGGSGGGSDANSPEGIRKRRASTKARDGIRTDVKRLEEQVAALVKASEPAAPAAKSGEATDDRILVWTHDYQVRPGATYRYRCRVEFANPFLGRKTELLEPQRDLGKEKGILSAPSEWATVGIRNPSEVFALEGMPGQGPSGLGQARFQLFKLDQGLWREREEVVELGDRVGSPEQGTGAPDFTTDWFVVGVYRDLATDTAARRAKESGADRRTMIVLANASDPTQVIIRRTSEDNSSPEKAELARKAAKNQPPAPPPGTAPKPGGN